MADLVLAASVMAGAICLGAGVLARNKAPNSIASWLFFLAMACLAISIVTGPLYPATKSNEADLGNALGRVFVVSTLLGFTFLWELSIVFPYKRRVSLEPPNILGIAMVVAVIASVGVGVFSSVDYGRRPTPELTDMTLVLMISVAALMMCLATAFIMFSRQKVDDKGRRSGNNFLIGIWTIAAGGIIWVLNTTEVLGLTQDAMNILVAACFGLSGVMFAYSIAIGQIAMSTPTVERLASSTKSNYRLFLRYVYIVEEPKPDFSFKLFADILKGRCWDCQNDNSFPCESLDCNQCKLPCPCRECMKYMSRPQGLVVSRQFPNEIRSKYYLQTTPIVWLSTVAGKDNMDPAKLNLLTDFLTNFMEKSHNGVVLVDGIEYLVTTNDFLRVIRAIDKWTESAMTSDSRLIITMDPKSFDQKELALLERNKEVVRPDAREKWMIIPEPI
jgi:hypothetical protein